MPDIPELRDFQCVNGCYTDIFGSTIWSPTRIGQVASFAEVVEMKIAQTVGPAPRQEAAPKAVVGKPKLTRKELKAMTPAASMEAVLSRKYEIVD
jgi:hypothetical protein